MKETIRDFYGKIIGTIEDTPDRKIVRDFYGKQLGYYDKKQNVTKDFYGKIIARGDSAVGLLYRK